VSAKPHARRAYQTMRIAGKTIMTITAVIAEDEQPFATL
jgi:hypothetical protein